MGNLPFFAGHPVGDVKTALAAPANITADLKCGTPAFKLCPLPWIGPAPATDRQAFKFPDWNFYWPGTYEIVKGKPVSLIFREKPIASIILVRSWPALPTKGSPCSSSSAPGPSPTKTGAWNWSSRVPACAPLILASSWTLRFPDGGSLGYPTG